MKYSFNFLRIFSEFFFEFSSIYFKYRNFIRFLPLIFLEISQHLFFSKLLTNILLFFSNFLRISPQPSFNFLELRSLKPFPLSERAYNFTATNHSLVLGKSSSLKFQTSSVTSVIWEGIPNLFFLEIFNNE